MESIKWRLKRLFVKDIELWEKYYGLQKLAVLVPAREIDSSKQEKL